MSHSFGIAIESLVAALLVLTIGYCMVLNKRLKRLKADEHSLKATIAELITATEIAERAIGGLKITVRDVNDNLRTQIAAANELSDELGKQLAEGDNVIRRLSKIVTAARPVTESDLTSLAPAPVVSSPLSVAPHAAVPLSVAPLSAAPLSAAPLSPAKAVAAAAQAFAERRRIDGLAA
ncbi:hypothetical protein BJ122_12722 [Rhodopseudomonas faecalis]|uniref:DUF6468 domain-containing protein n=1 Tax=Rhodopseudomonas faecalis TaxID=99655 RepID=A0A318TNG5_9BRAD|nr:DUF6468 domain-containing protein [Rhodopseudomonas faecalis]PYF00163.1 hypothetical protein BJ122_12722 [Rhodopseudomonas faecalis]TAH67946.1 MAG: chemotaxis protein [Rhodopseudomonas palustris]